MEGLRLPIALIWILIEFVEALQVNVTVDDADPRIKYTGNNWTALEDCENCAAGPDLPMSLHIANQANSKLEFNFTGIAISIYGNAPSLHRTSSNVSFTIDGTEKATQIANGNDGEANRTLFRADNLPNGAHTLSIQTRGDSLFILDYLVYTTDATALAAASDDTSATQAPPSATSTSDGYASSTGGAQPAVVGGVIGGIFGTFLLIGIVGLWFIRRSNKHRLRRKGSSGRTPRRAPLDRNDLVSPIVKRGGKNESGSSSGGPSDQSREGGKRKEKRGPVDYAFSSPAPAHTAVPLTTTRRMEALSAAATGGGGYRSATSTFTSAHSGGDDGKSHTIHAITTDTPQEAHPAPLYDASKWSNAKRPHTADQVKSKRHFSTGSTLEVDGVLERVMFNNSSIMPGYNSTTTPGYASSREQETPVLFSEHPFRTRG